mgnify:CR=1 FL=1
MASTHINMRVAEAVRWYRELLRATSADDAEFLRGQLNARLQTFSPKQSDQYYAEIQRVVWERVDAAAAAHEEHEEIVHPNPGMEWDF